MVNLKLRAKRNNTCRVIVGHFLMQRRQTIPGHVHVAVMGVVVTEVKGQPVQPGKTQRYRHTESMFLLAFIIALVRRLNIVEQGRVVG